MSASLIIRRTCRIRSSSGYERNSLSNSPCITLRTLYGAIRIPASIISNNLFTIVAFLLLVTSLRVEAQVSVGIGSPGPEIRQPSAKEQLEFERAVKMRIAAAQPLRLWQGKVCNVVTADNWRVLSGTVYAAQDNLLLILERKDFANTGRLLAITNAPILPERESLNLIAIRSGTIVIGTVPVALWDCGTPYQPTPATTTQTNLTPISAPSPKSTNTNTEAANAPTK